MLSMGICSPARFNRGLFFRSVMLRRPMTRGTAAIWLLLSCFLFLLARRTGLSLWGYEQHFGGYARGRRSVGLSVGGGEGVLDARNQTLGFEKVFVVALPERTDKRDSLALAASCTGIDFEWVDGVNGELVPEKALPMGWPKDEVPGTLGCWRAHMNIAQRMVKEQISSALIIEDDADWDISLKSQLHSFARGTRFLQSPNSPSAPSASPYGDDWDLLWLGHCGARNREDEDQPYYVTHNDPTAVPSNLWGYWRRQPNLSPRALRGNHTRVIYTPVRGLCTFSYALSLRGARRLLYHQSINGHAAASDRALQSACNGRFLGFRCYAPYPALISTHRAAGATARDSDREDTHGGTREKAETGQIVFSTRLNLERWLMGEEKATSQWPEDTLLREGGWDLEVPVGKGVWVRKEEYERPQGQS